MKAPALVFFLCSLTVCMSVEAQSIVAHRGASYDAPENTLAAFRLAWEQGADVVEGDFYVTKDGHVVCLHDRTTKRVAGVDRSVSGSTLAELRELDVGAWKDARWTGERIPTLEEVLAVVPAGKAILIEVKCGPEIVAPLDRILSRSKLAPDQTIVIAFDEAVVAEVKRRIPRIKAYWLTGYKQDKKTGRWTPTLDTVLETLDRCHADGLDTNCNFNVVTAPFVRALRARGFEFHAWTVNDPVTAFRLQRLGVDSVTTDRPAFLREQLPSRDLRRSLQVWLKLDGDLRDASPHARHGRFQARGDGAPTFAPAVFGSGLDLAERPGSVAVDTRLPDRGSIVFWYRTRPWVNYQTILDNALDADCWEMWIYESGQLRFRNHPEGASVTHAFHPTGDVDEWHHIALTWDRGDRSREAVRLSVNGYPVDSAGWGKQPWVAPAETFFIGGGHAKNHAGFGVWDDVAVFDTVLKLADIRLIMAAGVGVAVTEPLVAAKK